MNTSETKHLHPLPNTTQNTSQQPNTTQNTTKQLAPQQPATPTQNKKIKTNQTHNKTLNYKKFCCCSLRENHTTALSSPSSKLPSGFHPTSLSSLPVSGQRLFGSSLG